MRRIIGGTAMPAGDLFLGGGLAVFYVVCAGGLFARMYRQAVRTGLVARYSAETVS
jgi:ABC-2 type transport system permease protein